MIYATMQVIVHNKLIGAVELCIDSEYILHSVAVTAIILIMHSLLSNVPY